MSITYKVWIVVERHDDNTDEYEDLDSPFAGEAEFDNEKEAQAYALALHNGAQQVEEDDQSRWIRMNGR